MRLFYTAVLVLALASFVAAQSQAPMPQEPRVQEPAPDTAQPPQQTPPTAAPDPMARPQSDEQPMVDDQTLHRQVHEQFASDPAFRNIQVTVEEGKVRLEGTVASKDDKKRAKEMAKAITGVRKVSNKLKVDETMSATGAGEATTGAETRPESDVTGETQVTQPQTTTPPATQPQTTQPETTQPQSDQTATMQASGELKTQIETAFKNEPTLAGASIIVNVTETTIELSGSVPTGKERQTAKRIAQSFAGNRRVEDRLTVTGLGQDPSQTNQPNQTPPEGKPDQQPPQQQTPPNVL
jgi:osmotically-inducible protein OsmY